jgi:hypothetical protein
VTDVLLALVELRRSAIAVIAQPNYYSAAAVSLSRTVLALVDEVERLRERVRWLELDGKCQSLHKMHEEVERLQQALEDKPPPADAVLLAKANRMLHERCEALEERLRGLTALEEE